MGNLAHNSARFRRSNGVITGSTITPSFTISMRDRTGPDDKLWAAPCQLICEATATTGSATTEPFHELFYVWDFGDPSSGTWAYGANGGGQSKDIEYGPIGGHVYDSEGTYTITLTVYDINGTVATTSKTITVNNPDTCWPGAQTICLSTSATPNGSEPAGSTFIGSIDDVANYFDNNLTGDKRYLFRAGDSFTSGDDGFSTSITSLVWSGGTVTATTSSDISGKIGKSYYLTIAGVTPTAYNGTYFCTIGSDLRTLTYAKASNPGAATITGATLATATANSGSGWTDVSNIYLNSYGTGAKPVLDNNYTLGPGGAFSINSYYTQTLDNIKIIGLKFTNSVNNINVTAIGSVETAFYKYEIFDNKLGHILIYKNDFVGCGGFSGSGGYGAGYVENTVYDVLNPANNSARGPLYWSASPMSMVCGNNHDNRHNGEHCLRAHMGSKSIYAHNRLVNPNYQKSCATLRGLGYSGVVAGTGWTANNKPFVGYNIAVPGNGWFMCYNTVSPYTTSATSPNFNTAVNIGDTVVDNNVTWIKLTNDGTPWAPFVGNIVFRDNYCSTCYEITGNGTLVMTDGAPLSTNPTTTGVYGSFYNYIVEDNYLNYGSIEATRIFYNTSFISNLSFRNNICTSLNYLGLTAGTIYTIVIKLNYTSTVGIPPTPGKLWVYNNTIFQDTNVVNSSSSTTLVENTNPNIGNIKIANNLFYSPNSSTWGFLALNNRGIAYNYTFSVQNNTVNAVDDKTGTQTAVKVSPNFTNSSGTWLLASDFTTQSGSYARGAGQWLNNKWDFAHNARSVPVDMGAYES